MNYSIKKSSKWIPILSIRRGVSCSWLFIPRDSKQYRIPKISSAISGHLVTEFNRSTQDFSSKNQVLRTVDRNSASKFQSRSYSSITRRFGVSHSLNESTFRHYSQDNINGNKQQQLAKWFVAFASAGLVGGVIYKFFISDNSSKDANQQSDTEIQKVHRATKYPESSKDIPENVPYLLIGGGTASFSAFRAIKAIDSTAKVLIITDEPYYPYMRPPLSKELILNKNNEAAHTLSFTQWDGSERSVYYEPNEFYVPCEELNDSNDGGVSVARGWKVKELNPDLKYVVLEDGKHITYNKCLLATGATPKILPVFSNINPEIQKKVTLYRNLHDFVNLEQVIEQGLKSIVIVGGGFSGSELACSLARRGLNVTQIYKEDGNMAHVLPDYLSKWVTSKIQKEGIQLYKNTEVKTVELVNKKLYIITNTNEPIVADHVIISTGVIPNTDLASSAGLETDETFGGFLVNAELQARNDVYAAGDCACFYDKQLGRRRVEHHDHAVVSGRLAGENMTGAGKPFTHQSMFWSDLGPGLSYEAIGIVDSTLPTVSVYIKNPIEVDSNIKKEESLEHEKNKEVQDNFHKGIIFYLKNDKVVGMVMWNLFNRISIARQILKSNIGLEDLIDAAKLFSLHESSTE